MQLRACAAILALALNIAQGNAAGDGGALRGDSGRALQDATTFLTTVVKEPAKCEPVKRCEALGGTCLDKERCLSQGPEFRWAESRPGYDEYQLCAAHDGSKVDHAASCGCCFKKETGATDREVLERLTGKPLKLQTRGVVRDAKGDVEFQLGGDGSVKRVRVKVQVGEHSWRVSSIPSKPCEAKCDGKTCHASCQATAHSPVVDELLGEVQFEEGVWGSEMTDAVVDLVFNDPTSSEELRVLEKEDNELSKKVGAAVGSLEARVQFRPVHEALQKVLGGEKPEARVIPSLAVVAWTRVPWEIPPVILWPFPTQEEQLNLCVQPVRIRHRDCNFKFLGICFGPTYRYSGAGLAFGRPGADEQWAKVDISFTWRPWKTINDNQGKYEVVTEAEEASLRAKVNDDDCIEVFFVPTFSPVDLHGGGACWGSGTANAKIITSDAQVPCGVDRTHLAHELGHALGLMHPGKGHATFADASTGTLLCGSGWQRDNPRRNSRENGDNVQNPLLTCLLEPWDWPGPDCADAAACGSCAAHIPPDSC